jgi:hypothetical protein
MAHRPPQEHRGLAALLTRDHRRSVASTPRACKGRSRPPLLLPTACRRKGRRRGEVDDNDSTFHWVAIVGAEHLLSIRRRSALALSLSDLSDIGALVQSAVVVLGVVFAVFQLRQIEKARHLETIKMVFEGFDDRAAYADRQRILDVGQVHVPSMTHEDFLTFMRTADYFQRMAFLSKRGFLSRRYILEMYSGTVVSMWQCLGPFALHMRSERGLSNYSCDFEELATAAIEYRSRRFPEEVLRFAAPAAATGPRPASRAQQ